MFERNPWLSTNLPDSAVYMYCFETTSDFDEYFVSLNLCRIDGERS